MMERSKLLMELKPFFLRWVQQGVDAGLMGPALHMILLFHGDGTPVEAFDATSAGLDLALAAAVSGDVVLRPAGTIAGDHTVGAGVEVVGRGRQNTIFSGQIALGDGAVLRGLAVLRTASQAGDLIGVVAPASGMAYVVGCDLTVNNATGDGFAAYGDLEHLTLRWCAVSAQSAGADANPWGRYAVGDAITSGNITVTAENGVAISGLTVGTLYAIECTGGPWDPHGTGEPNYSYDLSWDRADWGTWDADLQRLVQPWERYTEWADADHLRIYFTAAETTLYIRVGDTPGYFGDNTSSLGYTLSDTLPGTPYAHGCVIPNADGRAAAIPEWGDRAAWDVADYGDRHASDWAAGDSHHAAVTLAASAAVLLGLSGQELSLDTQTANIVLAGPVSGTAAAPTFRALGNADLPDPLAFKTAASALGIVSGAVTATQNLHTITSETGTTDDLATITAAADRTLLLLQATATHTITVKHATGNISLNGAADFALSGDKALLLYWTGTAWVDVGAGGGGGGDAADVTYTPTTAADWDDDADPGNVDGALDQLAERVDDLEGGAAGGDVTWATIQASQLVNEFKGFPSVAGIDVDLAAANLWWDTVGSPASGPTMVDVAGEGITETYEYALKQPTAASGDGCGHTWTYADEPRVKAGRVLSAICAIWSVDSLSLTAKLLNSDASETAASAVTAAAWTIVKVENHTLAGTSCQFQVTAAGAGTFYVVPLGACIGEKAVPLGPRASIYRDIADITVNYNGDPGGSPAGWVDLDLTSITSALCWAVNAHLHYQNTTRMTTVKMRRNGSATTEGALSCSNTSTTVGSWAGNDGLVPTDDAQIVEYYSGAQAAEWEGLMIWITGYWEWA